MVCNRCVTIETVGIEYVCVLMGGIAAYISDDVIIGDAVVGV